MHFRGSCLSLEKATFVALDFVKLSHLFDFSPFWYQEDQKLVSFSASERGLYPLTVPERDVMPTFPDSEYVRNILCEIYRNSSIIIACGGLVKELDYGKYEVKSISNISVLPALGNQLRGLFFIFEYRKFPVVDRMYHKKVICQIAGEPAWRKAGKQKL